MRISDWSSDVCSSDLLMFVLGEPGYYGRFGFSAENAEGFDSPYAGPYFMAIELQGGLPCGPRGLADHAPAFAALAERSEEHTSELQSLMRISYAVFCLKKKTDYIIKSKTESLMQILQAT